MGTHEGTPKPSDFYKPSSDVNVGTMIECRYEMHEFCDKHAEAYLNVYPDRMHRSISIYEVVTSWRDYKCYMCGHVLWRRSETLPQGEDAETKTIRALTSTPAHLQEQAPA